MKRKCWIISILLSWMLCFCIFGVEVKAQTSHTVEEAIAWIKSLEGSAYDYDGVYGGQCVDLTKGYYNYLGVSPSNGNGCDYATNTLPTGWERIKGGVPQKGDILIYSGNTSNAYGHVAIYESGTTIWHGRLNGVGKVQKTTSIAYNGFGNPYWGLIRPDWGNIPTDGSRVQNSGVTNVTDTTARINANVTPAGDGTEFGFYLGTTPDNMQKTVESASQKGCQSIWYDLGTGKWCSALQKGTTYYYQIYAVINGVTYKSAVDSFTTTGDSTGPTITNIQVTDVTRDGYTVSCQVSDSSGVARVCFPTWSEINGQDDLSSGWYDSTAVYSPVYGDTYSFRVNVANHNYDEGVYTTHIYAYDTYGNHSMIATTATINRQIPLQSFTLNSTALSLQPNETKKLSITSYTPVDTTSNKSASWKSANTSVATVDSNGNVKGLQAGTTTITCTVAGKTQTCKVTVKKPTYIGNVNSELLRFTYDESTNYISGEIVVVEWVNGVSTVPSEKPIITFASTDGTETIDVYVTATGTNTYYFDRRLSDGLTPGKEYLFNVTSGNKQNVSAYKTVPIYTGTSSIGSQGVLGVVQNQQVCFKTQVNTGYLLVYGKEIQNAYEGQVNSVLSEVSCVTSDLGNFVSGNIVIVEWINGVSHVPSTTPEMTFEAADGSEKMDVFMTCLDGSNTYYFDRNLTEDMDVNKEYIFRISLTEENNISPLKSMVATTNYMNAKSGVLWETATQVIKYKTVWANDDNQLRIYAVNK